ncbi:MAG: hypothetical protein AB8G23_22470 [Myxococcota bacterium]
MRKDLLMQKRNQPAWKTAAPRFSGTLRVWAVAFLIIGLTSCERVPSKSDYVSAQVTALCDGETLDALRACRLAVINQFKDMPLEEMQRRFPRPEPRARPSCGA